MCIIHLYIFSLLCGDFVLFHIILLATDMFIGREGSNFCQGPGWARQQIRAILSPGPDHSFSFDFYQCFDLGRDHIGVIYSRTWKLCGIVTTSFYM